MSRGTSDAKLIERGFKPELYSITVPVWASRVILLATVVQSGPSGRAVLKYFARIHQISPNDSNDVAHHCVLTLLQRTPVLPVYNT